MTLLAKRAETSEKERITHNIQTPVAPETSLASNAKSVAAPEGALLTLKTRLQSQLDSNSGTGDEYSDVEARFLIQSVRKRLHQVNAALERIEEGKYGVCADCEKAIENDRMVLQPMSIRCTGCQATAEWRGLNY
jgi:RNA polymerase-binding transcription factor DksA